MESIKIEATKNTPEILFDGFNNIFKMTGRCIHENPDEVFDFFINTINEYKEINFESPLGIYIDLEYINTASTKKIYEIFRLIKDKDIVCNIFWYYEEDDEDIKETGEVFKDSLDVPNIDFTFIEKNE